MKKRRRLASLLMGILCLFQIYALPVQAKEYWPEGPEIAGDSAVVMEASTGTVIKKKNA